jgi:hypothetical protein
MARREALLVGPRVPLSLHGERGTASERFGVEELDVVWVDAHLLLIGSFNESLSGRLCWVECSEQSVGQGGC